MESRRKEGWILVLTRSAAATDFTEKADRTMRYAAPGRRLFSPFLRVLLLLVAFSAACPAASLPNPQQEIDYLLSFVGASDCIFYRNGSSYSAVKAEAHMRAKYENALMFKQVFTAEDFIDRIASISGLSGRPYSVKCGGEEEKPTRGWLIEALARFRAKTRERD